MAVRRVAFRAGRRCWLTVATLGAAGVLLAPTACDNRRLHVGGRSAQEWIAAVRDSGASRADAVAAIAHLATESKESASAIEQALRDPNPAVRLLVLDGIGTAGANVHFMAVERLERVLLVDEATNVRARAAWALGRTTADEPDAVSSLTVALRDTSALVRRAAAYALAAIGSPARAAAGPLSALRVDPDSLVRRAGAEALAMLRRITP